MLLASAAGAQRTWIVDSNGGPGADFGDLPQAFARAKDGDRLIVRKGVYSVARTDKGLRILGETGAVVRATRPDQSFVVENLGAASVFAMRGIRVESTARLSLSANPLLALRNAAGRIHLEDLVVDGGQRVLALEVSRCPMLTIARSRIRQWTRVASSGFWGVEVTFTASQTLVPLRPTSPGLSVADSVLDLTRCSAFGGALGHPPSYPAIDAARSTLVLRGDRTSRYLAGPLADLTGPAIWGAFSTTLFVEPAVVLKPPPRALLRSVTTRMPGLTSSLASRGGRAAISLFSPRGQPFAILGSIPVPAYPVPPIGFVALDPRALVVLAAGVQNAGERSTIPLPVPPRLALRGAAFAFQAVSGPGRPLATSNPVVAVVD